MIRISFKDEMEEENSTEILNTMAKKKFLSKTVYEEPIIHKLENDISKLENDISKLEHGISNPKHDISNVE